MLDHQPKEYAALAASGANLVLGGHTHGGQLLGVRRMIARHVDAVYGHTRMDGTDFIVSSGMSDWRLLFKTGVRSEFVVVDVAGAAP